MKERLKWLDYMKGILMLLIILSHAGAPEIYARFYTPVFLSGFFFCSGYTLNTNRNVLECIKNKLRTLMWPLLCLGTINTTLAFLFDGDSFLLRIKCLILNRNSNYDDLWFVACIFVSEMIAYFIMKFVHKEFLCIILSFTASIGGMCLIKFTSLNLIWQTETALFLNCFLIFGNLYKKHEVFINKKLSSVKIIIIMWIIYVLSVLIYNNNVNIHMKHYDSILLFLLSAFIGVFALVQTIKRFCINDNNLINKYILFMGKSTFIYYAFQSKVLRLLSLVENKIHFKCSIYFSGIINSILVSLILIIPAFIITRYFSFILGKRPFYLEKVEKNENK